jgi:hypothetical protein
MIEAVFNFQIFFLLVLLGIAAWKRSASVFALAGIFSILLGVALSGEGISYNTGYDVSGLNDNNMTITESYTTLHSWDTPIVNMWHYVFLYGGFVPIIIAFVLVGKARLAGGLADER